MIAADPKAAQPASALNVAVIGLGSMGYGVAQSLLRAELTTFGYDVAPEPVARFRAEGGAEGALAAIAERLDAVVIVVLNAAQTEAVLFGENGVAPRLRSGAVVLSSATVPPDFAVSAAERLAARGVAYLDAPISGGALKAAEGRLSVLASGAPEAFDAAAPVLDAMAEKVFNLGDRVGAGSAMKAVNQMLAGVHIAAMAEAIAFAMAEGVDAKTFLDVIPQCAGTSWMLENRAPHVVAGDYAPRSQVNIWPKDLGIVLDICAARGVEAPITRAALAQYLEAVDMGLGGEDDAAVTKVYARRAGLALPGEA